MPGSRPSKQDTGTSVTSFVESGGTLTESGKTYAVGLAWARVTDNSKIVAQAKAAAPLNGADLFVVRKPGRIQYGLGSRLTGHKEGMAPLASLLADVVDGNFIGAFSVSDGIYLVAVRDDQVLAGFDRLIQERDEAFEVFHDMFVVSQWGQAIAPKDWNLEGTTASTLSDLLTGAKSKSKLESVSSKQLLIKVAGTVGALALLYLGYSQYQNYEQDQATQAAAKIVADQQAEQERENQQRMAIKIPPMPWEGKPYGALVVASCVDAVLKAPISVAGWQPQSVSCTGDDSVPQNWRIVVVLKRDGGTINWIAPVYNHDDFKPSVTQDNAGNALVSWPLEPVPKAGYNKDSPTSTAVLARRYMTTQFEEVFEPIDLHDDSGVKIQVPAKTGSAKHDVLLERHLAFSFHTSHSPKDYQAILAPIPAFVATMVKLDVAKWSWTVEGTIYERIPLPAELQGHNKAPVRAGDTSSHS